MSALGVRYDGPMRGFLAGLIATAALAAGAHADTTTTITCKVYGRLAGKAGDAGEAGYKTIVTGSLTVDASTLVAPPRDEHGACLPVSQSSEVFGAKKGTRLKITASKCGSDDVYVTFRVILKGLPVLGFLSEHETIARVEFNDDGSGHLASDPGDPPLVLPEGKFRFVYADCKKQ